MNKRTPVSKIMTENLITVNTTSQISEVAQVFRDHNIHHIPVVSGDSVIGMISKTDIDKISYVNGVVDGKANTAVYDMLDLKEVMTSDVDTIQQDEPIKEAAEIFARGKYNALPVLEGESLRGIVTTTDVINYLLAQY